MHWMNGRPSGSMTDSQISNFVVLEKKKKGNLELWSSWIHLHASHFERDSGPF